MKRNISFSKLENPNSGIGLRGSVGSNYDCNGDEDSNRSKVPDVDSNKDADTILSVADKESGTVADTERKKRCGLGCKCNANADTDADGKSDVVNDTSVVGKNTDLTVNANADSNADENT
eukprot:12255254-Ditylum_brightwellii.AAC.1